MARTDPQLNFRIPVELRDRLEAAAGENKRSLTAELVDRLQASFNLEPLKDTKRGELVKLVNDAIDERMALEKEKLRLELEGSPMGFVRKPQQK